MQDRIMLMNDDDDDDDHDNEPKIWTKVVFSSVAAPSEGTHKAPLNSTIIPSSGRYYQFPAVLWHNLVLQKFFAGYTLIGACTEKYKEKNCAKPNEIVIGLAYLKLYHSLKSRVQWRIYARLIAPAPLKVKINGTKRKK